MNKTIKVIFIILCLQGVLFSQLEPPAQYPNYKVSLRHYINFKDVCVNPLGNPGDTKTLETMDSNVTYFTYDYNNSPLKILINSPYSTMNCVYSGIEGLFKASLSVSNNENSSIQGSTEYTNSIYECGKHYIDNINPNNSFYYDLEVKIEIRTIAGLSSLSNPYEVNLRINSYDNIVRQTKIFEDKLTKNNVQYNGYYISKITVTTRNTSNLPFENVFLEVQSDYNEITNAFNSSDANENLYITPFTSVSGEVLSKHYYDLKLNESDQFILSSNNPDKLFYWELKEPMNCLAYEPYLFQIQILKLSNTKEHLSNPSALYAKVDWSKSLTLELDPNECKVNNGYQLKGFIPTEGTGYYIWRVRPIGNYFDGGINNPKNYGVWSKNIEKIENGNIVSNSLFQSYNDGDLINIYFPPNANTPEDLDKRIKHKVVYLKIDEKLNWQHTRVYTEGNHNKSQFHDVMEFYNSSLLPVQTQRRLPSEKNVITQQKDYDMQNRLAIQSLPFAVQRMGLTSPLGTIGLSSNMNSSIANLNYKKNVMFGSSESPFNFSAFDGLYGTVSPLISSSNGLLNEYYDGDNNLGADFGNLIIRNRFNVPSAEGYPFTRTIYSNDGLNKVVEQSLPGKLHRIREELNQSSLISSNSKTVRNYVSTAAKEELQSMFGAEAPKDYSVIKEISIDPNNVISYSFKDFNGKVIASSLGVNEHVLNLEQININDGTALFNSPISKSFTEANKIGDEFIINGGPITIPTQTDVTLSEKYSVKTLKFKSDYCQYLNFPHYYYPEITSSSSITNPNTTNINNNVVTYIENNKIQGVDPSSVTEVIGIPSPSSKTELNISGNFNIKSVLKLSNINDKVNSPLSPPFSIRKQLMNELTSQLQTLNGVGPSNLNMQNLIDEIDALILSIKNENSQETINTNYNIFLTKLSDQSSLGYGWTKLNNSNTYTKNINNSCINIVMPDLDCDVIGSRMTELQSKYNYSVKFDTLLLGKIYDAFEDKTLKYTDTEQLIQNNILISSVDIKEKKLDITAIEEYYYDANGVKIITKTKRQKFIENNNVNLKYFFYQYGLILDKDVSHNSTNCGSTPFYDRINNLFQNFIATIVPTDIPLPANIPSQYSRLLAVDDFVNKFTKSVVRTTNVNDEKLGKAKNDPVNTALYIDSDINTLDLLFSKTFRSLIGPSPCKNQYIERAYEYMKHPSTIGVNLSQLQMEIDPLHSRDAWKPIEESDMYSDECQNVTSVNQKYFEIAYNQIDVRVKGFIRKGFIEVKVGDQVDKIKKGEDDGFNKELKNNGFDLNKIIKDPKKFVLNDEKEIFKQLIKASGILCDSYKPVFEMALREFIELPANNSYLTQTGNTNSDLTRREVSLEDLKKLVDVLLADCKQKTEITESQIVPNTGGGSAWKVVLTPVQEKYLDAMQNQKKVNIDKISFPTRYIRPATEPSTDNCRYTVNIGIIQNNPNFDKEVVRNITLALNDKLTKMKENLLFQSGFTEYSDEFYKKILTPQFRAERYREIIDYLQYNILPSFEIFDNYYYHNSDYIFGNNCIGDFYPEEKYALDKECSSFVFPYNGNEYKLTNGSYNYKNIRILSEIENWFVYLKKHGDWKLPYNSSRSTGEAFYNSVTYGPRRNPNYKYNLRTKSRLFAYLPTLYMGKIGFINSDELSIIQFPENLKSFSDPSLNIVANGLGGNKSGYMINYSYNVYFFESNKKENQLSLIDPWSFSFNSIFLVRKPNQTISKYDCNEFFLSEDEQIDNDFTNPNCRIVYSFEPKDVQSDSKKLLDNRIKNACYIAKLEDIKKEVITQYVQLRTNLENEINQAVDNYAKNIDKNVSKTVSVTYGQQMHHFTLYYYDRAGNLTRTVPPKGVRLIDPDDLVSNPNLLPDHKMITFYKYNANGQVVRSDSPDEEQFNSFKYGKKGFLKFSQSSRQAPVIPNIFGDISYVRYDKQMRIVETGEMEDLALIQEDKVFNNLENNSFIKNFVDDPYSFPNFSSSNPTFIATPNPTITAEYPKLNPTTGLYEFKTANLKRTQVVITDYSSDATIPGFYGIPPYRTYLRNKVNKRLRDEDGNLLTKGDQVITYYSYDAHNNVDFVVQDLPATKSGNTRLFAMTSYDYDLISKKVKKVVYNYYQADGHNQSYTYDEDNRLINVKSSRNDYEWDNDASYMYAPHGTLARVQLGHDNLQGLDYTYTTQGWLKAINNVNSTTSPATSNDPGLDGTIMTILPFRRFPLDAYSEVLNYFNTNEGTDIYKDFITSKGGTSSIPFNRDFFNGDRLNSVSTFKSLFNGNIASWESDYSTTKIAGLTKIDQTFSYDKLNRLKSADSYTRSGGSWGATDNFQSTYSYDRNGNITNLSRKDNTGTTFDALSYTYQQDKNKLQRINDATTSVRLDDIENQTASINYDYDASGNLIYDAAEGINGVAWTVDGKIKSVKNTTYLYDASGNRVMKRVDNGDENKYTLYARDANSQVMAIYDRLVTDAQDDLDPTITDCLKLKFSPVFVVHGCIVELSVCKDNLTFLPDGRSFKFNQPINYTYPVNNPCAGYGFTIPANTVINYYPENKVANGFFAGVWGYGMALKIDLPLNTISQTGGGTEIVSSTMESVISVSDIGLMPKLAEWHIYGNGEQGRFVTRKPENNQTIYYLGGVSPDFADKLFSRILGFKEYEIKDHLGNVRVAITDYKLPTNPDPTIQPRGVMPFAVDERAVNDYYPFGMLVKERSWSSSDYRYGYNKGSENDNEISGDGNHLTTHYRELDTRTAQWWSIDPEADEQSWQSPYCSMDNNPVLINDPEGDIGAGGFFWGAATDAAFQLAEIALSKDKTLKDFSVTKVIVSGALGAAGVGLATGVEKLAKVYKMGKLAYTATKIGSEVVFDAGSSAAKQYVEKGEVSGEQIFNDVVGGQLGRKVGDKSKVKANNSTKGKQLKEEKRRADNKLKRKNSDARQKKAKQAKKKQENHEEFYGEAGSSLTAESYSKIMGTVIKKKDNDKKEPEVKKKENNSNDEKKSKKK